MSKSAPKKQRKLKITYKNRKRKRSASPSNASLQPSKPKRKKQKLNNKSAIIQVKQEQSSKQSTFRINTTELNQSLDWILHKCDDGLKYIKDEILPALAKKTTTTIGVDQVIKHIECKLNQFSQHTEFMNDSFQNKAMQSAFFAFIQQPNTNLRAWTEFSKSVRTEGVVISVHFNQSLTIQIETPYGAIAKSTLALVIFLSSYSKDGGLIKNMIRSMYRLFNPALATDLCNFAPENVEKLYCDYFKQHNMLYDDQPNMSQSVAGWHEFVTTNSNVASGITAELLIETAINVNDVTNNNTNPTTTITNATTPLFSEYCRQRKSGICSSPVNIDTDMTFLINLSSTVLKPGCEPSILCTISSQSRFSKLTKHLNNYFSRTKQSRYESITVKSLYLYHPTVNTNAH